MVISLSTLSRFPRSDAEALATLLGDDERVVEDVSDLLSQLRVRVSRDLAEHSMATALLAAAIARVMGYRRGGVFTAGVVGALHEIGSLVVRAPTELESLRMAESQFALEKARFRRASLELLSGIPTLAHVAGHVADIYTDMVRSPIAQIVVVADWFDWFCSASDDRRALRTDEALTYLTRNRGVRFRKDVVLALQSLCQPIEQQRA